MVITNAHALQEPGISGRLCQGIFPFAAMTNHSCSPNATHAWWPANDGGGGGIHLAVRAVRDIDAGEEVTISYLDDLMAPFEERVGDTPLDARASPLTSVNGGYSYSQDCNGSERNCTSQN
jgi:SET domain-containing protein